MPTFDRELMTIDKVNRAHDIGNRQTLTERSPDLVEGYWADSTHTDLPSPNSHSTVWDGKVAWLQKLVIVEFKIFPNGQHNPKKNTSADGVSEYCYFTYGDYSRCRICNQQNGNSEYQIKIGGAWYRWPDGLRHYFEAHNVIPSKQFYDLINTLSGNLNW
jgi:hypothetical protein